MVRGRRWQGVLVGAACGLAMAACSSEPEVSAPTVELSTTTVTTLPPTTELVTTEAPTTTTEDPRIAEVEAAVAGLRDVQAQVLLDPAVGVELLADYAVGDLLESLQANTLQSRAEGRTFAGNFSRSTVSIVIGPDPGAILVECGHDRVAIADSSGSEIVAADPEPVLREISLVRTAGTGSWRVERISFVGEEKQACDL